MFRISAYFMVVMMLFCSPVFAQPVETAPVPAVADEAAVPVIDEEPAQDGMVSLNFRDVDIKDVLRLLSYESEVNIVAGPEVAGLVTIQLDNVPWKRALDVVVDTYGYAYDQRDNIITVTTIENLKKRREDAMLLADQEPLVTQAFVLNYAKAVKVIESVEKMKTDRGSVNYDERTNMIIVRDTASNVEMMGDVIKKLDKTTPQVMIEAKIIETTLGNTEQLGIDWNVQASANGAIWPTSWPLTDTKYERTDLFPDISEEDATGVFTYGTLDTGSLSVALDMLSTRNDTNTLSNPKIVTLDNQAAKIVVGYQYPFPEYTYNEDQAQMQVSGWEYKDIGVIFEVTPHVNNAGVVTLDLAPKVTAIDGYVTVDQTATAQVPQLTTREATTSVMIQSGDTLVIGGLISDATTDTESKFPLLGDIPLLGKLFRHKSTVKAKTELLIFLTPHIVTPRGESVE